MSRRRVAPTDLCAVRWLSDVRLSPDGLRVACVETRLDVALDRPRSRILVFDADAGTLLGSPSPYDAGDVAPRWSPDGARLAFTGVRADGTRLWLCDRDGGQPSPVAGAPTGSGEPAWSPDGRRLACSVATPIPPSGPAPVLVDVTRADFKRDGHPVGAGIASQAIWVVPLDGVGAHAVTAGTAVDRRPAWSPDGTLVAFLSDRGREGTASPIEDVWQVPADTPGADGQPPVRLTDGSGPIAAFGWSPDGRRIATLGHGAGTAQGLGWRLRVAEADGRRRAPVAIELEGSPTFALGLTTRSDDARGMGDAGLDWLAHPDGDRIWLRWADGARGALGWVATDGRWRTVVGGDRAVLAWSVAPAAGRLAFVASDPEDPGEVAIAALDGSDERRVSAQNDAWLAEVALGATERVTVEQPDGVRVEGWLTLPPGSPLADVGLPLLVSVHGGPHYAVGLRFSFEAHRLAALGIAVLAPNPRGSLGYGDAFGAAVVTDWGNRDLADVLALTAAAAGRADIDGDRIGITGVSYGGYMTLWAITQDPRFRSAISENGISDLFAAFGTSEDAGVWWHAQVGGGPWDVPDEYVGRSPLRYADRVTTPLLLLHAELDQNVSIAQSEQMFAALRMLGRHVEFVRVPGEGHLMDLVGSTRFRLARMELTRGFLERTL